MLYNDSPLAHVWLHACQVTGNEFYSTITDEIRDCVLREMTCIDTCVHTQDADSKGVESVFFVWAADEVREVLGSEADAFVAAHGITHQGNAATGSAHGFEGKNSLEFIGDLDRRPTLPEVRRKLYDVREEQVHPGRDEKVLTSWNGLMLAAFAEAARTLDRDDYQKVAQHPLGFGQGLQALAYALSGPREIAIVGEPEGTDTQDLLNVVRDGYRPYQVVALGAPNALPAAVPLLQDRRLVKGRAAAYVCRAFACQAPVTDPPAFEQLLGVN